MSLQRRLGHFDKFRVAGLSVIICAYSLGVFKVSFWSDDYPALLGTRAMADHLLSDGRPTSSELLSVSFSMLKDPANAWILRSFALIALLLIFLFVSKSISGSKHYNLGVLSIAIALCLPSFQMYVHWSTAWYYPWATLAGLYSYQLWSSKQTIKKILAALLFVLALTTYPPTAMFFFAAISVTNVLIQSETRKFFTGVIQGLVLFVISVIASTILVFTTLHIAGVSPSQRVKLLTISEIPNKIVWLFTRPIVVGLRPFMIDSPTPKFAILTSLPILIILFLGVLRQSRQLGELFLYRAIAIGLPLIMALIPIIATPDNQIEFRILPGYCWGLAAIGSFFLLVEIKTWLEVLKVKGKPKSATILSASIILSLIAIVSVNSHYVQLIGDPYHKKNVFLNAKISSCLSNRLTEKILIIPPKESFPSFARLGVFSMSTDLASTWVPEPNVQLLLRERKINVPVAYSEVRPPNLDVAKTDCVIDLEEFRKLLS